MDKKKVCFHFKNPDECYCNNDYDNPGECVYENGIEPQNPAARCLSYKYCVDNTTVGTQQSHSLKISFSVDITQEDIDDIMCSALEGGICYWCFKAEVAGEYLGTYASEQISSGGTLILHDRESKEQYELTLDKFMNGLRLFLEGGHSDLINIKNNSIDPGDFDGDCADRIIQFALFGDTVFC